MKSIVVVLALSVAFIWLSTRTEGQTGNTRVEQRPDLSGIWQAVGTAHWDLETHESRPGPLVALGAAFSVPAGIGVVEGGEIPYQPWAAAKKKENQANWLSRDPEIKCYLPGLPRATYMPYPFQIVQGSADILIAYSFANASRVIHMNQETTDQPEVWMGWSNGRWDGNTLVVDVGTFTDQTWLDRAGNFHSDQLHVVERYIPVSKDIIQYEATLEDPKVFTRPWKISVPLYRLWGKDQRLIEYQCIPFAEELMYGHLYKKSQ